MTAVRMEGYFPSFVNNAATTNLTDSDCGINITCRGSTMIDEYSLRDVAQKFRLAFAFITLVVATIGNSLTLAVMCRKSMRGTSAALYLSLIVVADTFVVYFGQLPVVVFYFDPSIAHLVNFWKCSVRWFLLYCGGDFAVWLILALTVDRFIAVWLPHRTKQMCTIKRAIAVCIFLFIFAILKNFSTLIAIFVTSNTENGVPVCGTRDWASHYMYYIRPWVAFALYAFIPIVSVFILNLLIIYRLIQVHQAVKKNGLNTAQKSSASNPGSSLTAMFLSVSIVFLVLLTPSILNHATKAYRKETDVSVLVTAILDSLAYVNHSINFFLYCLTGRRFRKEFMGMVGLTCRKVKQEERCFTRNTTVDLRSATNLA